MKLSNSQIVAICRFTKLRKVVFAALGGRDLLDTPPEKLSKDDWGKLHDAAYDAFQNDAPEVKKYKAEMSLGPFPLGIRGVKGAYFVWAQEFDHQGAFNTLKEAEACLSLHYGEFLI